MRLPAFTDSFDADWLSLREPADRAARNEEVAARLVRWRGRLGSRKGAALKVVDLGAGTGSALRYLEPRIPGPQDWTLVERDPDLIAEGARRLKRQASAWGYRPADLAQDDLVALVAGADLITGSALLDLCSAAWINRLVAACAQAGAAAWFSLNVTGNKHWSPADPADWLVERAFARDMRRDKGFGPALGPQAGFQAAEAFAQAGYSIALGPSNWRLDAGSAALQRAYLHGYASAAHAQRPDLAGRIANWRADRLRAVAEGRSHIRVGHVDLFAAPPGSSA